MKIVILRPTLNAEPILFVGKIILRNWLSLFSHDIGPLLILIHIRQILT